TTSPLVVPGIHHAGQGRIEDAQEVPLFRPRGEALLPSRRTAPLIQERQVMLIIAPGSPPRRPTPPARRFRKAVRGVATAILGLIIVAADGPNRLVVAVAFEQRVAEAEEVWRSQTVVFEDDRAIHFREHPSETAGHAASGTEIMPSEVSVDVTGP